MKTMHPSSARTARASVQAGARPIICLGAVVASILVLALMPAAAFAAPPATVASCEGIKDAYPILGTQCVNTYASISHNPTTPAARHTSFGARKTVLQIFQKALLCNGMYGATAAVQQRFKSGEDGHLQALDNLRTAMKAAGDPDIPEAYEAKDLKSISINKQQCK
jgi:hypothetical protein